MSFHQKELVELGETESEYNQSSFCQAKNDRPLEIKVRPGAIAHIRSSKKQRILPSSEQKKARIVRFDSHIVEFFVDKETMQIDNQYNLYFESGENSLNSLYSVDMKSPLWIQAFEEVLIKRGEGNMSMAKVDIFLEVEYAQIRLQTLNEEA